MRKEGGLRERMTRVRLQERDRQSTQRRRSVSGDAKP
jgi:hypothetical protein